MKKLTMLLTILMATSTFAKEITLKCFDDSETSWTKFYINTETNKGTSTSIFKKIDFQGFYKDHLLRINDEYYYLDTDVGFGREEHWRISRKTLKIQHLGSGEWDGSQGDCSVMKEDNQI
tara:strand:- start:86 stop:445 length:360 start_codon:yes stop_codon:yes gene_type:complete